MRDHVLRSGDCQLRRIWGCCVAVGVEYETRREDNTARVGVHAVGLDVEKTLKWIFREHPTSDHGIDAHVEIVDERRDATGRLIALQIKSGKSYFEEKVADGYVFRGDKSHLSYWMRHSLPVIVVLHDPNLEVSYWQVVNQHTVEMTEKGWKMIVPASQLLDASARQKLSDIADIPIEHRRLASLALAKPWMELLKAGIPLLLKAEEWVNKSSGRGSLTLSNFMLGPPIVAEDRNGVRRRIRPRPHRQQPALLRSMQR